MVHAHPRRRRHLAAAVAFGAAAGSVLTGGSVLAQSDNTDQYIAQYADAIFNQGGTELRLAPGVIDDRGTISEVLDASVVQTTCEGRYLVTVDLSASAEADDIDGVEVEARAGYAAVDGVFTMTGELTITPAGRGCSFPIDSAAITSPLTTDVAVSAEWRNKRGSVPIVYSGTDCGGDGICYYRDARAAALWSSDYLGTGNARTDEAFFFEGTYTAGDAPLAVVPSIA